MGFEVEVQDLRDSADGARDALRVVQDTTAPGDLRGIRAGIPGSRAEALADQVAGSWEDAVEHWVAAARRYARHLDACADRYEADDERARRAFAAVVRPGLR